MCQICTITTLSTSARWPKPLEPSISDLHFLITCIHDHHAAWEKQQKTLTATNTTTTLTTSYNSTTTTNANTQTKPLLSLLRTLSASLTSLEHERAAWWKSKTPLISLRAKREEVDGAPQDQQLRHRAARRNGSETGRLRQVDDGRERRGGRVMSGWRWRVSELGWIINWSR
jgi:hypothetical protein